MAGNEFYGTIQTPNRGAMYAQLLSDLLGKKIEERDSAQATRLKNLKDSVKSYRDFVALSPEDQEMLKASGYRFNQGPEDLIADQKMDDLRGQTTPRALPVDTNGNTSFSTMQMMPDQGASLSQPSGYDLAARRERMMHYMTGAFSPKELVDANVTDAVQGPQGLYGANRIQNKQALSADEKLKGDQFQQEYNGIKLPESKATIAEKNATTGKTTAETGKIGAETQKLGKETALLGEAPPDLVQGVLTDPQSYYGLPAADKKAVSHAIGRVPSKLGGAEVDRMNAAKLGSELIDDSNQIVTKWQKRGIPITGPVLGRFNEKSGQWGELMIPGSIPQNMRDEYASDIAQLREWLTALPVQEAKALAGGRTAYQVIQAITSVSPSLGKGDAMFAGSVNGLKRRFSQIYETINKKQWGGQPPQSTTQQNADPVGILK